MLLNIEKSGREDKELSTEWLVVMGPSLPEPLFYLQIIYSVHYLHNV